MPRTEDNLKLGLLTQFNVQGRVNLITESLPIPVPTRTITTHCESQKRTLRAAFSGKVKNGVLHFLWAKPAVSPLKISLWDFHFMTKPNQYFFGKEELWECICHYKKVKARNAFCHAGWYWSFKESSYYKNFQALRASYPTPTSQILYHLTYGHFSVCI